MDEIAGFETLGGEETPTGAFYIGFPDLDVHFSVIQVDSIVASMKLMSIDDILGVAGSEREDFCCWLRAHTSALYSFAANFHASYSTSKAVVPSFFFSSPNVPQRQSF